MIVLGSFAQTSAETVNPVWVCVVRMKLSIFW